MPPHAHADRLFGRRRGHRLRARQQLLLEAALPRLRYHTADAAWRARFAELWIEVGFGSGEHAQALAAAHPHAGLIACEVFATGICSLLGRLVPPGTEATTPPPHNLRLWDDDARTLLRQWPSAGLDRLLLLFPDPWPKTRHAGRRFVCPEMITLAGRLLRPGGTWRVASDDPTYQDWVTSCLAQQTDFVQTTPTRTRPNDWPPTRYETKALIGGRQPLYWTLTRGG